MSKVWYHYPYRIKTVWPAGTLPHGDSIFMADFLNQFVGWINYLNDCQQSALAHVPLVSLGDSIQSAAFWNQLKISASDNWLSVNNDLIAGQLIADGTAKANETAEYLATANADVAVGDRIHPMKVASCPIRNRLLKLRTRIDLLGTYETGWDTATASVHYWSKDNLGHPGVNYDYVTDDVAGFLTYSLYGNIVSSGPDWMTRRFQVSRNMAISFPWMTNGTVGASYCTYGDKGEVSWDYYGISPLPWTYYFASWSPLVQNAAPTRYVQATTLNPFGSKWETGVTYTEDSSLIPSPPAFAYTGYQHLMYTDAWLHPLNELPSEYQP